MATTTPNYGWPVPTSTDLVKNGATAIEALGDAIDSTVFGLGSGLVKLSHTNFTSVTSVSLPNNTFTSTYYNYRVVFNVNSSAASTTEMQMRLRAGGVDTVGTDYHFSTFGLRVNGATGQFSGTGVGKWSFTYGAVGNQMSASIDLYSPQQAVQTKYTCLSMGNDGTAAIQYHSGGYQNSGTQFDSLSIIPMASNMTGWVTVYGYKI
jgi:hypothetical protein